MPEAFWEMERRRLMGNRTYEIEGYAALEYPRESVATVLRMIDSRPKPRGRKLWEFGSRSAPTTVAAVPSKP